MSSSRAPARANMPARVTRTVVAAAFNVTRLQATRATTAPHRQKQAPIFCLVRRLRIRVYQCVFSDVCQRLAVKSQEVLS